MEFTGLQASTQLARPQQHEAPKLALPVHGGWWRQLLLTCAAPLAAPLLQVMAEDRPLMYLANPENGKKVVSPGLLWCAVVCCSVSAQWRRC